MRFHRSLFLLPVAAFLASACGSSSTTTSTDDAATGTDTSADSTGELTTPFDWPNHDCDPIHPAHCALPSVDEGSAADAAALVLPPLLAINL